MGRTLSLVAGLMVWPFVASAGALEGPVADLPQGTQEGLLTIRFVEGPLDLLSAVPTVGEFTLQGVNYRDYLGHEPRCGVWTKTAPAVSQVEMWLPANEPAKLRFRYGYYVTADHPTWPETLLTFGFLQNDTSWLSVGNNVVWVTETDVSPAPGPVVYEIVAYAIVLPGSGGLELRPQARVAYDHPVTDFADCEALGEPFVVRIKPS